MYEQICYDTVKWDNSKEENNHSIIPYVPYPQFFRSEQQRYQIPYPDYSSEDERPLMKIASPKAHQNNHLSSSTTTNIQSNQKQELHRELAYRQKMYVTND
ncbi:unnamed protein product [Didymodactylos carnosus]|uniref:Uncharacterized protein n=1 Tax=Didymodactylos carnosus TaxID=1234261 RepID=A0A8S2QJ10_9BILA|nr:unnamed protein product [Didymodactylos carnosus]CAF4100967.1 unnamed protein product [Didymodactylos carnosus]